MTSETLLHVTSLVFCGRGLLLRGPSGSGKSDLALRLMNEGAVLISDDHSLITLEQGKLYAASPPTIAGLIEIRGVGLVRVPYQEKALIGFCFDCVPLTEIERLPEKKDVDILGIRLPLWKVYPFEASAVAKIRAVLQYPLAHE